MATYQQTIRRGLPRVAGGPAWPDVEGAVVAAAVVAPDAPGSLESIPVILRDGRSPESQDPRGQSEGQRVSEQAGPAVALRRGLPRVAGGEPWPAAGEVAGAAVLASSAQTVAAPVAVESPAAAQASAAAAPASVPSVPVAAPSAVPGVAAETATEEVSLRRGLPRVAGGDPWPVADTASVQRVVAAQQAIPAAAVAQDPELAQVPGEQSEDQQGSESGTSRILRLASPGAVAPPRNTGVSDAFSSEYSAQDDGGEAAVEAAAAAPEVKQPAKPAREPRMIGSRPLSQWVKWGVWGVIGAILAAGIVVLAARGITTLPGVPEFLERHPGEYHIPDVAEPGFPAWARWTHFLNIFLMVLIIRSGLQVRQQQKPPAFWTPKKGGKKISINLWLHTSLDVLWMLNGAVFIVLLFVSGHWARIVPTSWEVFPNAASALLQYLTLDWPVENGWVNYNSLQQIMYFLVVFVAAPLAIITGLRMSEWWPEKAERLNRIYPAPLARAIHFPTMLFFVLFILIHVFLVLSTGALRNLNHMFAGSDALNWVGFWWFAGGFFVTVAAVFLARPLILAPIASLTGKVSNR